MPTRPLCTVEDCTERIYSDDGELCLRHVRESATAVDLDAMTVGELRDHADDNDIDLTGTTRKADIIAAIKAAPESEPSD